MQESTKAKIRAELKAATDVASIAERGGRDLNADERRRVHGHLTLAKQLKADDETADDIRAQFADITSGIGNGPDGGSSRGGYTPAGTKARGNTGHSWAKAVADGNGGPHYKGIIQPSGASVVATPPPPIIEIGRPVTIMRSLLPTTETAGRFSYFRQTVRTNNAAVVAPGAVKPTSVYEAQLVEDRTRVIAHLSTAQSIFNFMDSDNLTAFLTSEMIYGLERALEHELLMGDGTGEHLTGLNSTSGVQTQAYTTDLLTTTRKAVTKLDNSGYSGSGWVMAPADWEAVELSANLNGSLLTVEAGERAPVDLSARRLWSAPVVTSPSCPVGTAFYADFAGATQLWVHPEGNLIHYSENVWDPNKYGEGIGGGTFAANEIVWRAELRAGFGVLRPDAVVKVDMSA